MAQRDPERLRKYLEMITAKRGGAESAVTEAARGLESTRPAKAADAARGMKSMAQKRDLSAKEYVSLEAIIFADLRPAVDIVDGGFTVTHSLWRHLSDDAAIKKRIMDAIPSIGRIELPGSGIPYGGTGFVIGPNLVMTNRHVAQIFATGLGDKRLDFISGAKAGIDLKQEQDRPTGPTLMVKRTVMIHPYWDMAILEVEGLPQGLGLKLSLKDAREMQGHDIFVVGYPAFDPRNPADVQDDVMSGRYGVKRLQPGELQGGMQTGSFGKLVPAATHDCSTLGGNSGSAVIDLETGDVLALHFGGRYQERNYAVPAFELGRDGRVVAAGVNFNGSPPGGANEWADWWARADGGEVPAVPATSNQSPPGVKTSAPAATGAAPAIGAGGSVSFEIPLRITVTLGTPAGQQKTEPPAESVVADVLEAMKEPFRDTDFSSRKGYDSAFLNGPGAGGGLVDVPMPNAANADDLAKTKAGGDILDYENFSVRMHAKRRLALVTASNVTKEPKLRRPEEGRDYTRRGLSGLGENDQEKWFIDPRMDEKFQIPDVFFTKDRKAFDKGHVVRRDDVAWGKTYDILRRANGDTYHVTNCSPQVAGFNRSAEGDDNWGDLENHVLSEAASERLCVFAGPVLDENDRFFSGKGDGNTALRARIPQRFWKAIVARVEDGIAAYGFLLEQDLSGVDFEFAVPDQFIRVMTPLAEIAAMTGVKFADAVLAADQFDSSRGAEVARRGRARRRKVKA